MYAQVYQASTGRLAYSLKESALDEMPITSLRFRPASASSKTKNVLLAVGADGVVRHWHVTSSRCIHTITETDNQTYCVDYRKDAVVFATAGKDRKVRLYDEATKALISEMEGGCVSLHVCVGIRCGLCCDKCCCCCRSLAEVTPGHSNRVYSLKFDPNDDNTIVTGGWDNTVQIWDTRVSHAVRLIFGPHIAGDAVDIMDNVVLTGSWRPDRQLQVRLHSRCGAVATCCW